MNPSEFSQTLRNQRFPSTAIGGYRKKEVKAYLEKVSYEWERMQHENQDLRLKLDKAEAEISKLRNIETSLLTSLKDQQEANRRIIEHSKEEAKLRVARGQIKANAMVKQAEQRSREILRSADEKYQQKLMRMRSEMKVLQDNYQVIDHQTSHLIREMTSILKETMLHLSKLSSLKKISVHNEFSELNSYLNERLKKQKQHVNRQANKAQANTNTQATKEGKKATQQSKPKDSTQSFFEEVQLSSN